METAPVYDYIIIGAGPAGIYGAYRILSHIPTASILILERKHYPGGRTRMFPLNDRLINSGAYGLRPHKDIYGLNLLKSLNISTKAIDIVFDYSYVSPIDVSSTMNLLLSKLSQENKHLNTKAFIVNTLGVDFYNKFIATAGRSDFELECITDTLSHYGMDDNLSHRIIPVHWNRVWELLSTSMDIRYDIDVTDIINMTDFVNARSFDESFYARNIIIATDILTLRRLLPMYSIYNYIEAQPFMRIYGCFNDHGRLILQNYINSYTVVSSPLQNIIPVTQFNEWISNGNNMYIIAFADNGNAQALTPFLYDTDDNKRVLEQLISKSIGCTGLDGTLLSIHGYYTYPGTHYYRYYDFDHNSAQNNPISILENSLNNRVKFIHQAQRPYKHIWVVGEVVSLHQGWVEGALQSVESILTDVVNSQ